MGKIFLKEIMRNMIIIQLVFVGLNCEKLLMLMMVMMIVEKYLNNRKIIVYKGLWYDL